MKPPSALHGAAWRDYGVKDPHHHRRRGLDVRARAAQAVYDRFFGRPLEWGKVDCARMAAFDLRQFGIAAGLLKYGRYTDEKSAARALIGQGHRSLAAAVGALGLLEIAPAHALPADLIALPAVDGLDGLTVVMGNGAVLGWGDGFAECLVMRPTSYAGARAWRV